MNDSFALVPGALRSLSEAVATAVARVYADPTLTDNRLLAAEALTAAGHIYGEFIRLQCERDESGEMPSQREIEIWSRHGKSFTFDLEPYVAADSLIFEGGFLRDCSFVACPPQDLPELSTLRTADVGELDDDDMIKLLGFPSLTSLDWVDGLSPTALSALDTKMWTKVGLEQNEGDARFNLADVISEERLPGLSQLTLGLEPATLTTSLDSFLKTPIAAHLDTIFVLFDLAAPGAAELVAAIFSNKTSVSMSLNGGDDDDDDKTDDAFPCIYWIASEPTPEGWTLSLDATAGTPGERYLLRFLDLIPEGVRLRNVRIRMWNGSHPTGAIEAAARRRCDDVGVMKASTSHR